MVSVWYEYRQGGSVAELKPMADILASISVYGDVPPAAFVDQCHAAGIKVYRLMPGAGGCFDTPAHRDASVAEYVRLCREVGFDGIELDFQALGSEWRERFNGFLAAASQALHREGWAFATTVFVPPQTTRTSELFYDPAALGRHCDEIRVMCYDLHISLGLHGEWAGIASHVGFGPASTAPWGREAMAHWLGRVPRKQLRMALPAYGNDYEAMPGGKGTQIYAPLPPMPAGTSNECLWLDYEQVHVYRYLDERQQPHLFYASDARSTEAHLRTVDDLDIPGVVFWNFHAVPPETWAAVRIWLAQRKE
jgi:spore germination protein YaaH